MTLAENHEPRGAASGNKADVIVITGVGMPKDFAAGIRLGFLIHDVSRLRRVVVDRALKPVGITRSQWWLMSFLGRRDGMTQTALAADLDLTKVAVGGLLDRMEGSGLVERRADQRDGRIKRVFLTPAGIKLLARIRNEIRQVEDNILDQVSEASLETTAATLVTIKRTLRVMIGADEEEEE